MYTDNITNSALTTSNGISYFGYDDIIRDEVLYKQLQEILQLAVYTSAARVAALAVRFGDKIRFISVDGCHLPDIKHDNSLFRYSDIQEPVVCDLTNDAAHATNILVTDDPYCRYFASAPVTVANYISAYLCSLSAGPAPISEDFLPQLCILARQVTSMLDNKREILRLKKIEREFSRLPNWKLAEEIIEKQKNFYENILNSLPTDIAVFDPDHRYLFVNPGAIHDAELRKYIVGKDDFEYCAYRNRDMSIAERRRDMFLKVKENGEIFRWEDTIKNPEGVPVTHLRRLFPVYDDNGQLKMMIGFGIDISDRKKLEEKQEQLMAQLKIQNIQLVDFCNIISHNLRAPLSNLGMLVELSLEEESPELQRELMKEMPPVVNNVMNILNELVESIQVRQDTEIQKDSLDLAVSLQKSLDSMKMQMKTANAVLDIDFSEAPRVQFPSKYLDSLFLNLISNAIKYQSPDRPLTIKIRTERQQDKVILSVGDNGLGIDMAKHGKNLFKVGKVFHKHPQAKGFGLFMTRTQIEAMDGRIWAESAPGVGTTFFIEFNDQEK